MADRHDNGLRLMAGALEKLPAELQAQVKTFADSEQGKALIEYLGEHGLRQDEFSRKLDENRAQQQAAKVAQEAADAEMARLNEWYATRQAALAEYDRLKAEYDRLAQASTGQPPPKVPPALDPSKFVTIDQLKEVEQEALAVMTLVPFLSAKHYAEFGEVLDPKALLAHPKVREVGIGGVYEEVYKDRYAQKAQQAATVKEEQIRADERAKVLKESAQFPYPVRPTSGIGSPLDALEAKQENSSLVEAAAAEYERLQSLRTTA